MFHMCHQVLGGIRMLKARERSYFHDFTELEWLL